MSLYQELTGPYKGRGDVRLPVYPPVGMTAVTGSTSTIQLSGPSRTGLTTTRGVLLHDTAMPLFYQVPTNLWDKTQYQVVYKTDHVGSYGDEIFTATVSDVNYTWNGNMSNTGGMVYIGSIPSTFQPYRSLGTNYVPLMLDPGQQPFVYVPNNFYLTVAAWLTASGPTILEATAELETWTSPTETDVISVTLTPGTSSNPYAYSYSPIVGAPSSVATWARIKSVRLSIDVATSGTCLCALVVSNAALTLSGYNLGCPVGTLGTPSATTTSLVVVPEAISVGHVAANSLAWQSSLTHSVHMTMEMTSQITQREGTIHGARVLVDSQNPFNSDAAQMNTLPMNKRYMRGAEHGLVAHTEPGSDNTFRPRTFAYNLNDTGTLVTFPACNIRSGDYAMLFTVTDPSVDTPLSFATKLSTAWEYTTMYTTVPLGVTKFRMGDLESALLRIVSENPFRSFERGSLLSITDGGLQANKARRRPADGARGRKPRSKDRPKEKRQEVAKNTKLNGQRTKATYN